MFFRYFLSAGGVDPGKFLEEQLRRTVSEGIGPKKIDPSNLIKGDLPPKPAAPYRGDHDKSYRRIQGFGAANVSVADSYLDDEGWWKRAVRFFFGSVNFPVFKIPPEFVENIFYIFNR